MNEVIIKRKKEIKSFKAEDGALIHELFKNGEGIKSIGMASGVLEPNRKAIPHYHKISEEIYFIISGKGKVKVGDKIEEVSEGDAVYIPIGVVHSLESGSEPLNVLCISSPPYVDGDFIKE